MIEALTTEVETYLKQAEYAGYMASIVKYERPVDIAFYGINLLLFEGIGAKINKSGKQWTIQFQPADEYKIDMEASTLAVVTQYWKHTRMGYSSIQRMEESGNGFKQVPTPSVDVLPGQKVSREGNEIDMDADYCEGTFVSITSSNQLQSKDIGEVARNHAVLVNKLLSLEQYNPKLLGTTPISVMDLDDIIPFSIA